MIICPKHKEYIIWIFDTQAVHLRPSKEEGYRTFSEMRLSFTKQSQLIQISTGTFVLEHVKGKGNKGNLKMKFQ